MDKKKFLKPFAASVATLLAGTGATAEAQPSESVIKAVAEAAPTADQGLTLAKPESGFQLAQHASHSSHSSHASHSSHSSSAY